MIALRLVILWWTFQLCSIEKHSIFTMQPSFLELDCTLTLFHSDAYYCKTFYPCSKSSLISRSTFLAPSTPLFKVRSQSSASSSHSCFWLFRVWNPCLMLSPHPCFSWLCPFYSENEFCWLCLALQYHLRNVQDLSMLLCFGILCWILLWEGRLAFYDQSFVLRLEPVFCSFLFKFQARSDSFN